MVQPWALGMSDPASTTPIVSEQALEQQRHDELLRMRCVELVQNVPSSDAKRVAKEIYREVTGREWPEWPINRKGTISCEPT